MNTLRTAASRTAPDLKLASELLDLQYRHSLQASATALILGLVVSGLLWRNMAGPALTLWLLAVEVAGLLRVSTTLYYLHGGAQRLPLRIWQRITCAGTILSGLSWGGLGLLYGQAPEPLQQLVIVFTLMGICAGSATLVVSAGHSVQLFGTLALGPLIIEMLTAGQVEHFYIGVALSYYLWVVMYQGPRRSARTLQSAVLQVRQTEQLLQRLEDAERMAHMGHMTIDHLRHQATLSAEARRLLGISAQSGVDSGTVWNGVLQQDRERVLTLMRQALTSSRTELRFETQIEVPDGVRDLQVVQRFEYQPDQQPLRTMSTLIDITELKTTQRELHNLAFSDPLTGLANRTLFLDQMNKAVSQALRQHQRVGVLMLDLDQFKTVNDTLGHSAGDQLLVVAAKRLTSCVRNYDTVARLGGDEFAVVLSDVRRPLDAATVASKIVEVMAAPFRLGEHEIFISASIGIAICPNDADDPDTLLRHADIALFEAKAKGRANFQFYSAELTQRARERMGLETDLRHALARGELELHYQPKVRLSDCLLTGAEALLRWKHPQRGMVPPDRFIGLAEDTGLIVAIGAWVLQTSFATAVAWNRERPSDLHLKIAVNLSPRQFLNHDLVNTVREALKSTGCRPEWIELELTESLLLDERGRILDILRDLRKMGFTLAIDDFGTGYSALGYLTRFPITTLKIDRSFTQDITVKPERAAIVRAIVSMGHSLSLEMVAEGVETREQARFLQALDCQLAQGWHYGRPMTRTAFDAMLSMPQAPASEGGITVRM